MSNAINISDGVVKEVLRPGQGSKVEKGDEITVHCRAAFSSTGKKFWCTRDAGQSAFMFKVGTGQVITGWDEGCLTMKVGEIAKLTVDPKKAYGAAGFPAWGIEPNTSLDFEVEIITSRNPNTFGSLPTLPIHRVRLAPPQLFQPNLPPPRLAPPLFRFPQ